MNTNLTEIVLVVDNSGSMASIKKDIEGGFKTFIEKQRNEPGEAHVTQYNFNTFTTKVFEKRSINEVHGITINPYGSTALIDASVTAIDQVGKRLSTTPENERPGTILFVILTDGEENASYEYDITQLKDRVKHQQDVYNWKFIFLGANFDAIKAGAGYGFAQGTTMNFVANKASIDAAFDNAAKAGSFYRNVSDKSVNYAYSDKDRAAVLDAKP